MACVRIPQFSLQLLVGNHPEWGQDPVAVVDRRQAAGKILQVNRAARQNGIKPGMRYASALAMTPALRAGVVEDCEYRTCKKELLALLQAYTPEVEPGEEPGIFWLGCNGFERLYGSELDWSCALRTELSLQGYTATVVAGHSRYGTYAIAHCWHGAFAFRTLRAEHRATATVPLDKLSFPSALLRTLHKLGVRTVADLQRIPIGELRQRLGREAQRWHQRLANILFLPLQPAPLEAPQVYERQFEPALTQDDQVLANCDQLLQQQLLRCQRSALAIRRLHIHLTFEDGAEQTLTIQPAHPSISQQQLMLLLRLRLNCLSCESGVMRLQQESEHVSHKAEQLLLFAEHSPREQQKAAEALAEVRAQFGEDSVCHACVYDSHIPEQQLVWKPFSGLQPPKVMTREPCLVRRFNQTARVMQQPSGQELARWRLDTGWWHRPIQRIYHYIETPDGSLHWGYQTPKAWVQQGLIG